MLWWRDGIIYQIYPRSYADSDGDGIGDLRGILSKLDYLADLGIDAIWLSPVYPSPDVDFGYDISDYTGIDPKFGTLEDFDCLVEAAHGRGIRVVMDMVFNHTSDQHPWFRQSRQSTGSPYRDWYLWASPRAGAAPPNNWQSVMGGSGWQPDETTGQSYFHMFDPHQPDLNWQNPKVRQAVLDVFRFWMDRGVDGFRLDVFNAFFKHPALRDNPTKFGLRGFDRQKHLYDMDQPELTGFLKELRDLLESYPQRYMVGETFMGGASKAASYIGEDRLHAAFNFEFIPLNGPALVNPWNPRWFFERIQRWEHLLGPGSWPPYVFNNHDAPRSASRWGRGEDDARLKVAAALLLTLRGTPFLYYGEEIGMRDIAITSKDQVLDPVGKKYWPIYKGRDGCRSPMQWDASTNAGFTAPGARPWLPLHPNAPRRNVEAQQADPRSLLNFYKRLIALRRSTPALIEGMFLPLVHGTSYILAYMRQTSDQSVIVALNFSRRRQRLVLGSGLARSPLRLLLSSHRAALPAVKGGLIPLEPNEVMILSMEK